MIKMGLAKTVMMVTRILEMVVVIIVLMKIQVYIDVLMLLKLEEHVKYYVVMEILMIKQIQCGQKSVTMVIQ